MAKRYIGLVLSVFFLLAGAGGCASPQVAGEFSADTVMKFGGMAQTGKIYFAADKWRTDMTVQGKQATSIIRADKKVVWMLMPGQKRYMEMKYVEDNTRGFTKEMPGEVSRQKVGAENVNGIACDKYKVTYKAGEQPQTIYQWISKDIAIPVKTAAADGSWSVEYKNLKIGKQPAAVFELPAGYTKFKMPDIPGMPKGLF